MLRYSVLSLIGVLTLTSPSHAENLANFYGVWRIRSIAGYAEISAGSDINRNKIGRTVLINHKGVILPGQKCADYTIMLKRVEVDPFMRDSWRTFRADLRVTPFILGKTALNIDSACADALVLDRNHLLMSSGDGAFFLESRER